jgi:predicted TIM-barrel fold metal-dependent hydrolase
MTIVDAQIHIWTGGKPANVRHRQIERFTADDALKEMDVAGVDAAVIHPPTSWDPNATALAIEAVRRHPDRFAILGSFPLDKPESRGLIDGWKKQPGMLGLRFTFLQEHQKSWPTDGTMDGSFRQPSARACPSPCSPLTSCQRSARSRKGIRG